MMAQLYSRVERTAGLDVYHPEPKEEKKERELKELTELLEPVYDFAAHCEGYYQ